MEGASIKNRQVEIKVAPWSIKKRRKSQTNFTTYWKIDKLEVQHSEKIVELELSIEEEE